MVTTAWNKFKKSREELREEIRRDARKEGLDFALKADKEKRPGETLEQAIERLLGRERP